MNKAGHHTLNLTMNIHLAATHLGRKDMAYEGHVLARSLEIRSVLTIRVHSSSTGSNRWADRITLAILRMQDQNAHSREVCRDP